MIKLINPLTLALPFVLATACGSVETTPEAQDEELFESTALALVSEDEEADEIGEDAIAGMADATPEGEAEEQSETIGDVEPPDSIDRCDFSARLAEIKDRFDEDADGALSDEERQELREELRGHVRPRRFRIRHNRRARHAVWKRVRFAFDANHDGTLDEDERAELLAALQQRCENRRARVLENWDANGDGVLDEDERQAARDALRDRLTTRRDNFLEKYDSNGDGRVDGDEREAVRADRKARHEQIRSRVQDAFDENGDGTLDDEELSALKAALRERIANGPGQAE